MQKKNLIQQNNYPQHINIIILGTDDRPASIPDVEDFEKQLKNSGNKNLVSHHAIRVLTIQMPDKKTKHKMIFKLGSDANPITAEGVKDFQKRLKRTKVGETLVVGYQVNVDYLI